MIYETDQQLSQELLKLAKRSIDNAQIISFPTETVYALTGSAECNKSIERLYRIKERDRNKRLSLLLPNIETAQKVAEFNDTTLRIASHFWPGPLTMILPLKPKTQLASLMTEGYETIGIRIPDHPIALQILNSLKTLCFATSANISGTSDNVSAKEVETNLGSKIDIIIDGGDSAIKVASTVIDTTKKSIEIIRQGEVTQQMIEAALTT